METHWNCPECNSTHLAKDIDDGNFVCEECGLVLDGLIPENRAVQVMAERPPDTFFEKCSDCETEVLVSIAQLGISHIAGLSVTCKPCMRKRIANKDKGFLKFKKKYPKEAARVEKWTKG